MLKNNNIVSENCNYLQKCNKYLLAIGSKQVKYSHGFSEFVNAIYSKCVSIMCTCICPKQEKCFFF